VSVGVWVRRGFSRILHEFFTTEGTEDRVIAVIGRSGDRKMEAFKSGKLRAKGQELMARASS
jgi:hypothetical protein